jgi:hypothetical protein
MIKIEERFNLGQHLSLFQRQLLSADIDTRHVHKVGSKQNGANIMCLNELISPDREIEI